MCYQHMHYESLRTALAKSTTVVTDNAPLIIDLGAGPATAGYAIAEHMTTMKRRPIDFSYYAFDRAFAMVRLAREFLSDKHIGTCVAFGHAAEPTQDSLQILR